MTARPLLWLAVATVLAIAAATDGGAPADRPQVQGQTTPPPDRPLHGADATPAGNAAEHPADPLLAHGLRFTFEDLLAQAGPSSDPAGLKQALAGLIGGRFPPAWSTRALALAERYVDYRVALGGLRAPQDPSDLPALRNALQARQALRSQFFDAAEYLALFAHEDELDRFSLARMEVARNPQLTPEQRTRALLATEQLWRPERRAERQAATAHLAAAAQTAAFDAQHTDIYQRHAARSAAYGQAAAHALARLDREERQWQQRLDLYRQAGDGDPVAVQQLRQQPLSAQERLRVDAALALRQLQAAASAGLAVLSGPQEGTTGDAK